MVDRIIEKNKLSAHRRRIKILNWKPQKNRVLSVFSKLEHESRNGAFIDFLYSSEDEKFRQIQLHSGRHPIGFIDKVDDFDPNKPKYKQVFESGAAIVLSQISSGEVSVLLYPYKSSLREDMEGYIQWSILDSPDELTHDLIKSIVTDFFRYARFSSSCMTESKYDRARINFLKFKGKRYKKGSYFTNYMLNHWGIVLVGFVGSICSIVGAI